MVCLNVNFPSTDKVSEPRVFAAVVVTGGWSS